MVLSGVFEVCVSSAIAPPIIPLLVDWLQVPVTAGGPFVGDCPLAEKFTNTNTNTRKFRVRLSRADYLVSARSPARPTLFVCRVCGRSVLSRFTG